MEKTGGIYLSLCLVSATVLSFKNVSPRISSVMFASDLVFILLSIAVLGFAGGGVFSFYRLTNKDISQALRIFVTLLISVGISQLLFLVAVIDLEITTPVIYCALFTLPFCFARIFCSEIFKHFARLRFRLCAADLAGAALGLFASFVALNYLGAPNAVFVQALVLFGCALAIEYDRNSSWKPEFLLLSAGSSIRWNQPAMICRQ
jgi:hypothetical protein